MGADISRARFDPLRDFAGLVLQQGRLLLDADFNDYVGMLDRRLRAETCDLTSFGPVAGQQGEAWVPRQTADGFRVTVTGGALTIGRGRMYVDGLLAENHGRPPLGFDPLLSEVTGTAGTPYTEQPYWPTPAAVPTSGALLAYLDVWEREVTSLEDPSLVEIAVGVDTAARWQTVWQVRLLPDVGSATCATEDAKIPGWLDVVRPSAGRLTTGTVPVAPDTDPCALPPTGGYRGLENQTYRVEVHTGGAPGTATFKWSRDNASVAVPVVEMVSTTVLRVASVGKDDVLRISTGDWVEIVDDHYELDQRPGELRKVMVDDSARTVSFTTAIPADLRPADAADAAARHLRVRRWDQSGVVRSGAGAVLKDLDQPGSNGLITVPAGSSTQVVLEHGVVVSFPVVAGGRLRPGDYWIFAARTADTSVESLQAAPPMGIKHHYARLAVVNLPNAATDCRRLWPPLPTGGEGESCDCTVCVTPESHASGHLTVQMAVQQVQAAGGTVCLAAGIYVVPDGVLVEDARSVRIRGQGPATVLVARGTALTITRSAAVTVEHMALVSGAEGAAAIQVRTVVASTLSDLAVLSYRSGAKGGSAIELSGANLLLALRRNVLVASTGLAVGIDGEENGRPGMLAAGLRVEDNVVVGSRRGIDLGGMALYLFSCRVTANEVLAGAAGGIVATGAVAPGGALDLVANKVSTTGDGITVGTDALVDANTVGSIVGGPDEANRGGGDGIVVTAGPLPARPGHVRITGNRVHDRRGTGIALRAAVQTFLVKQNVLERVGAGIAGEGRGGAGRASVENNEVLQVALRKGTDDAGAAGIVLFGVGSATVAGNTVARVGTDMVAGQLRAGILVLACGDVRVDGNVVEDIGPRDEFVGLATGIMVVGPFETLEVSGNSVRSGRGDPPKQGSWHALLIGSASQRLVNGAGLGTVLPVGAVASGFVLVTSTWAKAVERGPDHVIVGSNFLAGGGAGPACLVTVDGDVVAEGNQCTQRQPGELVAMSLRGGSVTAATNRLRGERAMLVLEVREDRFAAVGNLTPGGTHLGGPGNGLPAPWDALNPMVP